MAQAVTRLNNPTVTRLSPLKPGQAVVGMEVHLERGRQLISGHVESIVEPERKGRPRRCVVRFGVLASQVRREVETNLLIGNGRG